MKKLPFQKSDELIDSFLDKILDSKKGLLLKVKNVWSECVGKDLSFHTEPEEVNGGILYVKVKSSLWKKELKMTMGRILHIPTSWGQHTTVVTCSVAKMLMM